MTMRKRSDAEARTIIEHIETAIARGQFAPGDRLPAEKELCASHGTSRHTVRKALSTLKQRGLVIRNVGRGSFVRGAAEHLGAPGSGVNDGGAKPNWSLFELTEARLLIEPAVAALVIERAAAEDRRLFEEAFAAIERADDWRSFKRAKYAFHLAIVRAARNGFLTFVFEQIIAARERDSWSRPGSSAAVLDAIKVICIGESRAVLEAIDQNDAAACADAIRKSLFRILSATTA